MIKAISPSQNSYYFRNFAELGKILLPDFISTTEIEKLLGVKDEEGTYMFIYEGENGMTVPMKIEGRFLVFYKAHKFYAYDVVKEYFS